MSGHPVREFAARFSALPLHFSDFSNQRMDELVIATKFQGNLDGIATELIRTYALKFTQEVGNLSSPLLRWLDFRFRYVDPRPRPTVFSDEFPKRDLPQNAQTALNQLVALIQQGKDINPYQGRGLLKNDISANRNSARTDFLWADWNILHFHLSDKPIPDGQYFSARADYLAFCLVGGNGVAFIDVLRHPDRKGFADPELMETIARNWPEYLEEYRLDVIVADSKKSMADIHALRHAGISSILTIDGKSYIPSMGLTSAATPFTVTLAHDKVRASVRMLARMVCDSDGQFHKETTARGVDKPQFSLAMTAFGLTVHEAVANHGFVLPRAENNQPSNDLEQLHDLIMPKWVLEAVRS
jgi:hypothetical protein